jgi:hypothetical protein
MRENNLQLTRIQAHAFSGVVSAARFDAAGS